MATEEAERSDEETICTIGDFIYRADLRVFGAIGFQDAPNGLWLGKQGYRPKESLIYRFVENALAREINIVGLTSEDDLMIPGSPEDRFGFFKKLEVPSGYQIKETESGVLRVDRAYLLAEGIESTVYLVNCETRHANRNLGQDWKGLKVHVVGGNCLRKDLNLEDTIKDANDQGYMTFLIGPAYKAPEKVLDRCTGIIGHDANNTFPELMTKIPIIGKSIKSYSRVKNELYAEYAKDIGKPSIAVSSAHWMHEIGRASITFEGGDGDEFKLADLRRAIETKQFERQEGHNRMIDVLRFGSMLRKYGGAPDRFAGDPESSYNR